MPIKTLQIISSALLLYASSIAFGFDQIPVSVIYSPPERHKTADEALTSGHVREENFPMAAPASKPWRIAFLFPHIKDPYWVGCDYGVISEAKRLGISVDILPSTGYDDLVGQMRNMDQAIAKRYDAIVISPISQTANNSSIARARAHGIPVFELANDSTSDKLNIKVTSSLKGMGSAAMQWVIRDAKKRGLKSVNVALLPGPADAGWVKGEVEGSREAADHAPIKVNIVNILYGDSDLVEQSRLAARLLTEQRKKLDYILGCTGCAPAAVLPVRMAGLEGKVRIVAFDLTREIAEQIQKGYIKAAADTKGVSQARIVTDAAVNYLEGRGQKFPSTILVKLGLLDQENFADYDFGSSIAPAHFDPVLSFDPGAHPR